MMWRWRSTIKFTTINKFTIAFKWNFPSAKSTRLFVLVAMRITGGGGANAWWKVERVMGDRCISRKCKGNVLSSCVISAYTNAVQCTSNDRWQRNNRKSWIAETNNLVKIIVGAKRADKRKWMRWEYGMDWRKVLRRNWWGVRGLLMWKKAVLIKGEEDRNCDGGLR